METLLSGLSVAAIAALSWVAWHEEATFRRLHRYMQRILIPLIAFCLGYNAAAIKVLYAPENFKSISGADLAKLVTDAMIAPQVLAILLALIFYLLFLRFLPDIRGRIRDDSKNDVDPERLESER